MNNLEDLGIAVIGPGYIGLPLATEIGKKRPVAGVGINSTCIADIHLSNLKFAK